MSKKDKGGRPPAIDATVLAKLEDAFAFSYTDEEACLYANISPATLYRYQEAHPEFRERKELLRKHPNLTAKKTLVEDLKSVGGARFWATNKMGDEFTPKTKVEVLDTLDSITLDPEDQKAADEFDERLKQNIIKRRIAKGER